MTGRRGAWLADRGIQWLCDQVEHWLERVTGICSGFGLRLATESRRFA